MKRVIIESPFGTRPDGSRCTPEESARNVAYLKRCIADALARGEAPFASHGFYPLVLDDATPDERRLGIEAGLAWGAAGELCAVYLDYGNTSGMSLGGARHVERGIACESRWIGPNEAPFPVRTLSGDPPPAIERGKP